MEQKNFLTMRYWQMKGINNFFYGALVFIAKSLFIVVLLYFAIILFATPQSYNRYLHEFSAVNNVFGTCNGNFITPHLSAYNAAVFRYLFDFRNTTQLSFLSPDEISHMSQVKQLNQNFLFLSFFLIALLVFLGLFRPRFSKRVIFFSWQDSVVTGVVLGTILIFWNKFFLIFHELFFKTNFSFPYTYELIHMYYPCYTNMSFFVYVAFSAAIFVLSVLIFIRANIPK